MLTDRRERRLERYARLARLKALAHGLGLALILVPFYLYQQQAARLPMPGLLDPLYYHHVAEALESGRGLEIKYLWSYGYRPSDLVHPSNAYWGPGPSALMALGHSRPAERPFPSQLLWLFWIGAFLRTAYLLGWLPAGSTALAALPSIVLLAAAWVRGAGPALHPHIDAMLSAAGFVLFLAYRVGLAISGSSAVALLAAFALAASYPFTYFATTTDSPIPFALAANLALLALVAARRTLSPGWALLSGAACGLAALTRGDGIFLILLCVCCLGPLFVAAPAPGTHPAAAPRQSGVFRLLLPLAAGFLAIMTPWWLRNVEAFGSAAPASIVDAATLSDFNDLYCWRPPESGRLTRPGVLVRLAGEKLRALGSCLSTLAMGDLAMVFLFVPIGLVRGWRRPAARPFYLFAMFEYLVLSLVFTAQTLNGSFLHSAIAILPMFMCCGAWGILLLARNGARARGALPRTLGKALPAILVALLALGWWRSTAGDTALPALLADTRQVFQTFAAWARQKLPTATRLLTNMPFETFHYTRLPCAIIPRDDDPSAIDEVARRYKLTHAVIFANPKYSRRAFDRDSEPIGSGRSMRLIERIPVARGPAGFSEIRVYELPK